MFNKNYTNIIIFSTSLLLLSFSIYGMDGLDAQSNKYNPSSIANVSNDSLKKLYRSHRDYIPVHIPRKHLNSVTTVKEIFKQYDIIPPWQLKSWNESQAEKKIKELIQDGKTEKDSDDLELNDLPSLLTNAKTVLKSFLATDKRELATIVKQSVSIKELQSNYYYLSQNITPPQYIEKFGINRLFTYAYLQRVINQKNKSHIHLSRNKILAIRKENEEQSISSTKSDNLKDYYYLSPAEVTNFIDNNLKICLTGTSKRGDSSVRIALESDSDNYDLVIFAHKEQDSGIPMSLATYNDLKELSSEAPFDVGYNNIFSDPNGDAIIIDTEFKGECSAHSIAKLSRYRFQKS